MSETETIDDCDRSSVRKGSEEIYNGIINKVEPLLLLLMPHEWNGQLCVSWLFDESDRWRSSEHVVPALRAARELAQIHVSGTMKLLNWEETVLSD